MIVRYEERKERNFIEWKIRKQMLLCIPCIYIALFQLLKCQSKKIVQDSTLYVLPGTLLLKTTPSTQHIQRLTSFIEYRHFMVCLFDVSVRDRLIESVSSEGPSSCHSFYRVRLSTFVFQTAGTHSYVRGFYKSLRIRCIMSFLTEALFLKTLCIPITNGSDTQRQRML
jgi:hypothetical protein